MWCGQTTRWSCHTALWQHSRPSFEEGRGLAGGFGGSCRLRPRQATFTRTPGLPKGPEDAHQRARERVCVVGVVRENSVWLGLRNLLAGGAVVDPTGALVARNRTCPGNVHIGCLCVRGVWMQP